MKIFSSIVIVIVLFLGCSENRQENNVTQSSNNNIVNTIGEFSIEGMMCEYGCKSYIVKKVNQLEGVKKCNIDFELKRMQVEYASPITSSDKILQLVNSLNDDQYSALLIQENQINIEESEINKHEKPHDKIEVSQFEFKVPNLIHLFTDWL